MSSTTISIESSIEKSPMVAIEHINRSCNYEEINKIFRRRSSSSKSNGSINDSVVADIPEIHSCKSITSNTSASTLTASPSMSFDVRSEALHKVYSFENTFSGQQELQAGVPGATEALIGQVLGEQYHVHPQKEVMKRHRRDKTATLGMVGAGVGTLILPVIGTVVGGIITGYATNKSLKRYEKKIQRKWERDQFQKDASASQVARHAVFA